MGLMLESTLLAIVFSYVFGYVAVKIAAALIEWEKRRKNTPQERERLIQAQLNRLRRGQ